jgi:subfamily B ATP-binding cassette protein MsbA
MTAAKAGQQRHAGRFFRDWLAPQWRWFLLGGLMAAVAAAAAYGYADITARAMDWLKDGGTQVMTLAPIVILVLVVVRSITMYAQTQANNHGVQNAIVRLQEALFSRLIDGDYATLQRNASGEFVSQFSNDMTLVREASLRVASNLAKSVLTVAAALAFMFVRDWALALFLMVAYPIAFLPIIRLGERIRKTSRRAQEQAGEMTALLTEAFQGARTVKAFALEDFQKGRARASFEDRARLYLKILRSKAVVDPFLEVVGGLALAGLFAFAGWRAATGEMSVGDLVGFITAIAVASPEVRALGTLNSVLNEGLAAAERIYRVIDLPQTVSEKPDAVDAGRTSGAVEFDGVGFGYAEGARVLDGLSFTARAGETIALVGPSGAGKSTIFNLLLRLYDVDSGAVQLDGRDVRALTLKSLRGQMALVAQDSFLFDTTIRQNIALGRPDATSAEIEAAAAAASCDFIEALPQGWETRAGEGGRNLSGGQRQRIALARALLSQAPILLLDEATSALDSESETRIQAALASIAGSRTILVIAHRLATVRKADRIFVVDGGRIVESGTHDELVASAGAYARLAALQLS